jgi:hypothetical protein
LHSIISLADSMMAALPPRPLQTIVSIEKAKCLSRTSYFGATVHQPFDDELLSLGRAADSTFRIALA